MDGRKTNNAGVINGKATRFSSTNQPANKSAGVKKRWIKYREQTDVSKMRFIEREKKKYPKLKKQKSYLIKKGTLITSDNAWLLK